MIYLVYMIFVYTPRSTGMWRVDSNGAVADGTSLPSNSPYVCDITYLAYMIFV